jgi:2'-5' RNA ligase
VLSALERFAAEVAAAEPEAGDVKWIAADALHATVHFLGDVRESEVRGIEDALRESYRDQPSLDATLRGVGVFPDFRRPRILWVALRGDGLLGLAERAETALSPLGFPPEEREFRPHVTVARIRSPRGFAPLAEIVKRDADRTFGETRLDHAVLYKSDLRPERAVYTPLATIPFGA